jgi:prefoldin beta subunit
MDENQRRQMMMEFERNRQMLGNVLSQKQQIDMQIEVIGASLEELENTSDKTVMKIIGNIMISKPVAEMKKELKEQKESFELRLKTMEKQEETLMKKLNSLKAEIEGTEQPKQEDKSEKKSEKK